MLGHSMQSIADRLGTVGPLHVMRPAFRVIDRVQGMDPAAQVMGSAVAVCAMAEALGLSMADVIRIAERILADSEGPYTEHIQAIRAYARGELMGS